MNKIYVMGAALVSVLASQPAFAALQECTITWTPNSEADLKGYRVYASPTSRGYKKGSPSLDVPATQNTAKCSALNLPSPGVYFFGLTAYDTTGNESEFSNEMSRNIGEIITAPLAYVTRVQTDADGATVTISGPAVKLYVVGDKLPLQEVVGYIPQSATHRFLRRWTLGDNFICFIAENIEGKKTEQGCNVPVIGPDLDTVPPAAPTIIEVK
jgi:hypothetical protein